MRSGRVNVSSSKPWLYGQAQDGYYWTRFGYAVDKVSHLIKFGYFGGGGYGVNTSYSDDRYDGYPLRCLAS